MLNLPPSHFQKHRPRAHPRQPNKVPELKYRKQSRAAFRKLALPRRHPRKLETHTHTHTLSRGARRKILRSRARLDALIPSGMSSRAAIPANLLRYIYQPRRSTHWIFSPRLTRGGLGIIIFAARDSPGEMHALARYCIFEGWPAPACVSFSHLTMYVHVSYFLSGVVLSFFLGAPGNLSGRVWIFAAVGFFIADFSNSHVI